MVRRWDLWQFGIESVLFPIELMIVEENGEVNPPQGVYDWMDPVDYEDLMDAQQVPSETRATSYISVTYNFGFDKDNIQYMFAGMDGGGINYSNSHGMYWENSNFSSGNAMDSMVDPESFKQLQFYRYGLLWCNGID